MTLVKLAPKGTARRLYQECAKISAARGPYVYGGGHGVPLSTVFSSKGTDCSSSTSLALWRSGFFHHDYATNSSGFADWGVPGEGKRFTVWYSVAHVWIEFSPSIPIVGHALRFDTSPWGSGGYGPRIRWGQRGHATFRPRHYPHN